LPDTTETAVVSLAALRRGRGDLATRVLFNERQRIFVLPAGTGGDLLQRALRRKAPVKVRLDLQEGAVREAEEPSPEEREAFLKAQVPLEKPEKGFRVDLSEIDPTTFNLADKVLKVPLFRLCRRVIPNYKTARKIFDFCAAQSCHLPGPHAVSPCIPFQYVRDGCYARAHKMRWIITTRYRYCCEKVFSFANENDDDLSVQAAKWGGCCVTWWYHVAPLVRVKVLNLFTLAMVIDPGMFDKPVLLSTWLGAQENPACSPNPRVSMFSIQPGSAYTPANYAGTAFNTDPAYASTDATLVAYANLTTCP
jgi:hypothetical protein